MSLTRLIGSWPTKLAIWAVCLLSGVLWGGLLGIATGILIFAANLPLGNVALGSVEEVFVFAVWGLMLGGWVWGIGGMFSGSTLAALFASYLCGKGGPLYHR